MSLYNRQIVFFLLFSISLFKGYAQKEGIFCGIVKDSSTGKPITDAIVIAKIDGKTFYAISDTIGKFYLTGTLTPQLTYNEITLTANHIDYIKKI